MMHRPINIKFATTQLNYPVLYSTDSNPAGAGILGFAVVSNVAPAFQDAYEAVLVQCYRARGRLQAEEI